MNKKMYVDVTEVCEDWGVSRAQGYKIIKSSMNGCLPSIRILSFCPARQTESSTRRTVMAWQKKHKKRPFSGKRKVSNTSEAVMYYSHIYYITASQLKQS